MTDGRRRASPDSTPSPSSRRPGERLALAADDVSLFAGSPPRPAPSTSRSARELPRLLSSPDDDAESWIVRLPSDGPVEIHFRLPRAAAVCRIWNCSASADASSPRGSFGSRRVDLELDGRHLWSGELDRFHPCQDGTDSPRLDVCEIPLRSADVISSDSTPLVDCAVDPSRPEAHSENFDCPAAEEHLSLTQEEDPHPPAERRAAAISPEPTPSVESDAVVDSGDTRTDDLSRSNVHPNDAPSDVPVWLMDAVDSNNSSRRPMLGPDAFAQDVV